MSPHKSHWQSSQRLIHKFGHLERTEHKIYVSSLLKLSKSVLIWHGILTFRSIEKHLNVISCRIGPIECALDPSIVISSCPVNLVADEVIGYGIYYSRAIDCV